MSDKCPFWREAIAWESGPGHCEATSYNCYCNGNEKECDHPEVLKDD